MSSLVNVKFTKSKLIDAGLFKLANLKSVLKEFIRKKARIPDEKKQLYKNFSLPINNDTIPINRHKSIQ